MKHRLDQLDSPDPNGWTVLELCLVFDDVSANRIRHVLQRLIRDQYALVTDEGRFIASGRNFGERL